MQPCLPAPHVYFWKTASYGGLWQSFSGHVRHDIRIFGYAAERCAKSYATGRKNFLFHDSVNGARSSAVIYSLVETAKANHLNVFQYLYTLLLYMPDYKNEPAGVEAMMPWSGFIKERCSKVMDRNRNTGKPGVDTTLRSALLSAWKNNDWIGKAVFSYYVLIGTAQSITISLVCYMMFVCK